MKRAVLAAISSLAAAAPVAAQTPAGTNAYPSLDPAAIADWLQRESDLAPDQVVAVSPSAVTAVVASSAGTASADYQVKLRALALAPDAVARSGAAAWEMSLEVDCVHGKVRVGPTFGYADRRASGQSAALAPGDAVWRSPRPGTQLDSVLRASCDAKFARPLAGFGRRSAARAPIPVAASKRPEAPPVRLAAIPPILTPVALPSQAPALQESTPQRLLAAPVRLAAIAPLPMAPAPAPAATEAAVAQDAVARAPARSASESRAGASRATVQVISSPDADEARARLRRLDARFHAEMAQLSTRVEPATVHGRAVYRGMVGGFASRADAAAFCDTLRSAGQACLLRWG